MSILKQSKMAETDMNIYNTPHLRLTESGIKRILTQRQRAAV